MYFILGTDNGIHNQTIREIILFFILVNDRLFDISRVTNQWLQSYKQLLKLFTQFSENSGQKFNVGAENI